jgi:hypothetical protein
MLKVDTYTDGSTGTITSEDFEKNSVANIAVVETTTGKVVIKINDGKLEHLSKGFVTENFPNVVFEDDDAMGWSGYIVNQLVSHEPVKAAYDKLLEGLQGLRNAGIPHDRIRAFALDALADVSLEDATEADAAVADN